jgi:hypothetical protein
MEQPSPFIWGGGAVIRDGGVRFNELGGTHDPSVGDYAATSPFEWGGLLI